MSTFGEASHPKNRTKVSLVHRIGKCSASRLPPIATFSQKCIDSHKLVEATLRSSRSIRKRYARCREFYCTWSTCPRALKRIPFLYKCRLKCHMRLHLNKRGFRCSNCDQSFNTTLNWKRHQTIHQESKTYRCPVCSKQFSRSSEWSRCRKHHRLLEEANVARLQPIPTTGHLRSTTFNWSATDRSVTTSLLSGCAPSLIESPGNAPVRLQPYKCPVCPRTRAYTDPGSLRKHMRLYHQDYRTKQLLTNSRTSTSTFEGPATASPERAHSETTPMVGMVQPLLIPVTTTEKVNNANASDVSVVAVSDYYPEQFIVGPVWVHGSSQEAVRNAGAHHCVDDSHVPPTVSSFAYRSSSCKLDGFTSESFQSSAGTVQPMHSLDAQYHVVQPREQIAEEEDDTQRWNVPVDLCNSALCLQTVSDKMIDFPVCTLTTEKSMVPSQLEAENADLVTVLSDSSLLSENAALDLTEPLPYIAVPVGNDVIDLSGDATFTLNPLDPIDLSAPQPQRKDNNDRTIVAHTSDDVAVSGCGFLRLSQPFCSWDPEPGFSFTDLLINDFDDPDTIFNHILSNDLSVHSSPCKTAVPTTPHASANLKAVGPQPPPLDLRLPHAPMFSF
ncbi:hypothetical protein FGIG_09806 [Fasciola gigantica]|uniref:C2H2-type domain-containing protein n=1 Tax=Fasciola gigantica TaxID=46835 RepID=A0A504YJP7_FASGI|nr:hypothetical protein FGIG_09806 [Fasciola gigantica]